MPNRNGRSATISDSALPEWVELYCECGETTQLLIDGSRTVTCPACDATYTLKFYPPTIESSTKEA